MRTLLRGGTLVTADRTVDADILVQGESIAQIGSGLSSEGAHVVDASGKLILPGGVDPHTHFDLPMFDTVSSDDHYTGHKAAAFGGTTTVLDFVPFDEPTMMASVQVWRRKAEKAAIDYGFHMNLTRLDADVEAEMSQLRDAGITTLKVFTAYNGRLRLSDRDIFRTLRLAKDQGMLVMAHCENGDVIETSGGGSAVGRAYLPGMACTHTAQPGVEWNRPCAWPPWPNRRARLSTSST